MPAAAAAAAVAMTPRSLEGSGNNRVVVVVGGVRLSLHWAAAGGALKARRRHALRGSGLPRPKPGPAAAGAAVAAAGIAAAIKSRVRRQSRAVPCDLQLDPRPLFAMKCFVSLEKAT